MPAGPEADRRERRLLAHETRLDTLGLDRDDPGDDVVIALAEERHVVDAVQERDHDGLAHTLGRRQFERRLELGRLRRHPEDVDLAVEHRRARDVDLEVAEHDALDAQPAGVAGERLGSEEQKHVGAAAGERAADEAADTARAEDSVAHAGQPRPARRVASARRRSRLAAGQSVSVS